MKKNKQKNSVKEGHIELEGVITKSLQGRHFLVDVEIGGKSHSIMSYLCGRMFENKISVLSGDKVKIAVSPYDLSRGRIMERKNKVTTS